MIAAFTESNARFVAGELTVRDHRAQIGETAEGQFPKAIVLSCLDSRISVEDVFDRGIDDIFVARVAGNLVNTDFPAASWPRSTTWTKGASFSWTPD